MLAWKDIPNKQFLLNEIPEYHPASSLRTEFWKKEKRKCIEGVWNMGKFMPPKLYFYVNFGTILLNKSITSKQKIYAKPLLRDLEWEVFLNVLEARGFSGFEEDDEFTCLRLLIDVDLLTKEELQEFKKTYPSAIRYDGQFKTYENARTYLRRIHSRNMGRPLYENEAKDLLWLASRGVGKSYITANVVLHEWLFDGITDYDEYLAYVQKQQESSAMTDFYSKVSVLVGAADAKYSRDTLLKTKDSLERLPGGGNFMINGEKKYIPSPFSKAWQGSWDTGGAITATYKKKMGGSWKELGSKSTIKNRSFKDNAFAGQGDRNTIILLEEIGVYQNLIESKNALEENMKHSGTYKFGTALMVGTGGSFENGGTLGAYRMFYDPKTFNLVEFDDIWEHRGRIGFFTPAYYGLNDLKDINGNTDIERATKRLLSKREQLMNSKSGRDTLDNLIQYQPLVPSEVFLVKQGNQFPIFELKERLSKVQQSKSQQLLEKKITLRYTPETQSGVDYDIDVKNKLEAVNTFPWPTDRNKDGCIVVYELPEQNEDGKVPDGLYIIGHDPYRSDSSTGESLAATIVMKTKKYFNKYGHDEIVAVYYGRPYEGRHIVNENLLKLSMFYNAKVSFENNVGNVKEYFEKNKALHRLLKTPQTVLTSKASYEQGTQMNYGYPISNQKFKLEALSYVRDWLLEIRGSYNQKVELVYSDKNGKERKYTKDILVDDRGNEIPNTEELENLQNDENFLKANQKVLRNLDFITDEKLLLELIAFNMDNNFDAVMSLCACVLALEESHNKYLKVVKDDYTNNEWKFLTHNTNLFQTPYHNPDTFFKC